ncbi:MAG: recombinase family protein [Acidobacteriota bacterium]
MRAVAYLRVSTEDQVENSSLDNQERACREYCERQGFELVEIFREEGRSARSLDRPELKRMLHRCNRRSGIEAVVVYAVSRLARDTYGYVVLRRHFADRGVSIHSVTEPIRDDAVGRMTEGLLAVFAQFDNDLRSERVTAGMKAAVARGRWVWVPPYGYRSGTKEGPSLEVDQKVAPYILQAYDLVATGLHRQSDVLSRLNAQGFRKRNGKPWDRQTLRKVLTNPLYMGRLLLPKWGVDRPGDWEPLITERTWYTVQRELDGRRPVSAKPKQRAREDFPLRSLVRDAESGEPLTSSYSRSKSGRQYAYYHTARVRPALRVRRHSLHEAFLELLRGLRPEPELLKVWKATILDVWQQRHGQVVEERKRLEKQADEVRERKDRLVRAFLFENKIDEATYDRLNQELEADLTAAEVAKSGAQVKDLDIETALRYSEVLLNRADHLWTNAPLEQRQRLFGLLFPEGLEYHREEGFRTPVTLSLFRTFVEEREKGKEWCARRDSNP